MNFSKRPFRPVVEEFAHAMEYKLSLNDHKGGWENCDFENIKERLRGEIEELTAAIDGGNDFHIMMEAADVANYAMMLAWLARHRITK